MIFRFDAQNPLQARVFLDDKEISGVVLADEEAGVIYKLKEFPMPTLGGSLLDKTILCASFRKDERGQYIMEMRRGTVRVELPPAPLHSVGQLMVRQAFQLGAL